MSTSIIQFMKGDIYAGEWEGLKKLNCGVELVSTGRNAHPQVVELADTVSEVLEVKHAYQKDVEPQPGIDY